MKPARRKSMLELSGGGDDGTTGLLGGGRAAKDDPRVEAVGTVDEASSAVGLAKTLSRRARVRAICEELQRSLYLVGAELGTAEGSSTSFAVTSSHDIEKLNVLVRELEERVAMPTGFVLPGTTQASAALDLARAIVRRAERRCVALRRDGARVNPELLRWLNRLSLLLFVLARYDESLAGRPARPARTPGRPTRPASPARAASGGARSKTRFRRPSG